MKKIALCSLLACMCAGGAYAGVVKGADCLREFSPANNNWFARSDEYLFPTEEDYLKVVNRGTVYECDNNQCGNNTYVEMPAGHWFDGFERTTTVTYKCVLNIGNDKWVKVDSTEGLTKCTKSYEKWGSTGADSDEYIYPTKADYDAVTKSEYGHVYECDSNVCKQGTEITLDSVHYFGKEKVTTSQRYVCVTKGGYDYWMKMDGLCNGGDCDKQCTFSDGSKHNLGESVEFDCSRSPDTPEFRQNARTGIKCYQSCLKRKSDNKLTNYWSVKTCPDDKGFVAFNSADYQKYTPDIPGYKRCDNASEVPEIGVTPDIKSCKEKRTTAEGKACCDLPASDAKWENNQCKCLNDKEFKIVDGRGFCVAKEQPVNEGDCLYKLTMDVKCNNGHTYYKGQELPITKEQAERLGGCDRVKSDIDSLESILAVSKKEITQMQEIIKLVCGDSAISISPVVVVYYDEEKIKRAQDTLSNFASRASKEASGWKTEDGKFNTMRLASDLSAGVVLGTVGGVVSGVVIKKKQVEKGFDALHCTVGGQTIADWGDTFSVGLQR